MHTSPSRLNAWAALAAAFLLIAVPASAQYKPRPLNEPATGEAYHIVEADLSLWLPTADMTVASESLGILGSQINLKTDLGITDQHFPSFNILLRPARKHKFRYSYIPIGFDGNARIPRDVIFNGIRYSLNTPVNSMLDWKAYRFGYEYDFLKRERWFAGVILEAKYTDVRVELDSPFAQEFARARGPLPAIGGIGRIYVAPNIAITGELTGFKIPDTIDPRYAAHYVDLDIYGTVNITENFGVKGGYRSLDLGYLIKTDVGSFVLQGFYFGGVVRY